MGPITREEKRKFKTRPDGATYMAADYEVLCRTTADGPYTPEYERVRQLATVAVIACAPHCPPVGPPQAAS